MAKKTRRHYERADLRRLKLNGQKSKIMKTLGKSRIGTDSHIHNDIFKEIMKIKSKGII